MVTVKKTSKKGRRIRVEIIYGVVGVTVLVIVGLFIRSYLVERLAITELANASKELKIVFDSVLKDSGNNVVSSYFRNDCSVSHTSWLEQNISCGPSGSIALKTKSDVTNVADILRRSIEDVHSENSLNVAVSQDSAGLDWRFEKTDVKCSINYGQNILTNVWSYDLVCRKGVSAILPGYKLKE